VEDVDWKGVICRRKYPLLEECHDQSFCVRGW
jgi:hypothetical protein